ncbi:hypothetical protein CVIRNUC_003269 [Coccomyxa viridis]|uniref:Uncharacterized protein n=1 Tax=Coccomyxa viridis TaxID=1274662 RepID=A0AAV1I2F9_9CHLO|nr:hypothetical protein CVIRNUC_003269 [Coccomyxa viridis]
MGSRDAFFDRYVSRIESIEASERTRLLQEVKRGRVVAFGQHCYVVRLRPTLVDLVGESFKDLSSFTAILFKGWPLDSAELPLAAKRVFVRLFSKGSNCGGIVVPAAGMDRHGLAPQILRSNFLAASFPPRWGRRQELADAASQVGVQKSPNPEGGKRGKKRRADGPPETPTSGPRGSEWPASRERLAAETLVGVGRGIVSPAGAAQAVDPTQPVDTEANTTKVVSDRAKHHIQQATAGAIQEMQRWFCGQIQRLAKERDTYKALADERQEQLQAWEKALRFMPTKTPDLMRGRRLSVGV